LEGCNPSIKYLPLSLQGEGDTGGEVVALIKEVWRGVSPPRFLLSIPARRPFKEGGYRGFIAF